MLTLERLEARDTPSVTLAPNGTLYARGGAGPDVYFFGTSGTTLVVGEGARVSTFPLASVSRLDVATAAGNDSIQNATSIPSRIVAGPGGDTVIGGTGPDVIAGGAGADLLYDLLGGNTILDLDGASGDRIYANAADVVRPDPGDRLVSFFAPNRLPGSGAEVLERGVLYIAAADGGTTTTVIQVGNVVVVNGSRRYAGVSTVAYFGGRGDDRFTANVTVDVVGYGGLGGNDTLVGGFGRNLLKGGSGNDVIVGQGRGDDLGGDAGSDVILYPVGSRVRRDALDLVFPR